jgi:hypothetical protein
VYRVVRSSDHGDLSRKKTLTMQVCPMKKLVTLRRNSMRLTKRLKKFEEQNEITITINNNMKVSQLMMFRMNVIKLRLIKKLRLKLTFMNLLMSTLNKLK